MSSLTLRNLKSSVGSEMHMSPYTFSSPRMRHCICSMSRYIFRKILLIFSDNRYVLQYSSSLVRLFSFQASIKEDGDNLPTVFLQDTVALGHCSRHHFNSKFIAILAFAGICFLLFIATIVYMIYRRCQRKRKEPIPNMSGLYASQTEPLDNEINDPPTAQGTSSTTVIKNVIFKGNCTGGQAEESQLPMIHEESTDRDWWFAYENVSVLRDEVAPRSKRDKSNWRSKSKEGSRGRLGSDEASVPVIARSESMRSNSASNTSSWSYLPHSVI